MRAPLVVGLAILFAGCFGSPNAGPSPSTSGAPTSSPATLSEFAWSGTGCGEFAIFVNVPADNVRSRVDPAFTVVDVQGEALMALSIMRCAEARLGNDTTNNLIFSD